MSSQVPVTTVDVDAELRVIAAMFTDPSLLGENHGLDPQDFSVNAHQIIFAAMQKCDAQGRPVDVVTIADELTREGTLSAAGGHDNIRRVSNAGLSAEEVKDLRGTYVSDFATYVEIVTDRATRRRLLGAARKISSDAASGQFTGADLATSAEQAIFAVSSRSSNSDPLTMAEVTARMMEQMTKARTSRLVGHSTGFKQLDDVTAGLQPGQMMLIAGRPGTGKSVLALQICRHISEVTNLTVPFFSYEMSHGELGLRMLSAATGIPLKDLTMGYIPHGMDKIVAEEVEKMANLTLLVDDTPPVSIAGVASLLRRLHRRTPIAAFGLDYLQLISGAHRKEGNREGEVSEISRTTKLLASELGVPAIACSQLNRGLEARADKRPMLSDLRESGSLEQDASQVLFVYRDALYNNAASQNEAELILAKNRNGQAPYTINVRWDGPNVRFSDIEQPRRVGGYVPDEPNNAPGQNTTEFHGLSDPFSY